MKCKDSGVKIEDHEVYTVKLVVATSYRAKSIGPLLRDAIETVLEKDAGSHALISMDVTPSSDDDLRTAMTKLDNVPG